MKTADLNHLHQIRVPVVDCNEGSGRCLFQFVDSVGDLPYSKRWRDHLAGLPEGEREAKHRASLNLGRASQ